MSLPDFKQVMDLCLIEKQEWRNACQMKFKSSQNLPTLYPGQFVQVKVENSPASFLRRPLSVNFVEPEDSILWLLVQKVGPGTRQLAGLPLNSIVNMILPLGNSFTLPSPVESSRQERILLIGGGIGTAPLLFLGKTLFDLGQQPIFLLGGRSAADVLQVEEFRLYGELYITTQDGSLGEQGLVTEHSIINEIKPDKIYCCGPRPMMEAVAALAKKMNCWCEVSLENLMACGFGACLCCVEKTDQGHVCTCTEGPVFNINQLLW